VERIVSRKQFEIVQIEQGSGGVQTDLYKQIRPQIIFAKQAFINQTAYGSPTGLAM
jgi:hypothetical protein